MEAASSRLGISGGAPYAEYNGDPIGFDRDVMGNNTPLTEYWEMQRKIVTALEDTQRVLVATANGTGKSTLIGRVVPYFMTTRENARVRLTAGTGSQVANAHRKIRSSHLLSRRPLPGEVMKSPMWELGPEWLYDGVSPDSAETMQGLHSTAGEQGDVPGADGGLLAIIDEASATEDFKYEAMAGYMTTNNTYWLIVGNPNKSDGQFKEMWDNAGERWARIQVSAYDAPEHIISRQSIKDMIDYWGEDSPQVQVRVHGQFPSVGGDYMVFPMSDLEGAADMLMKNTDGLHLGVDVARGESDQNTMVLQDNRRVIDAEGWHSRDLMKVAERVAVKIEKHNIPHGNVHVDVIGLGAGVVDRLREGGYFVEGCNFGSTKVVGDWKREIGRHVQTKNRRAELYWAARCLLRRGHASVPREFRKQIWLEACRIQYLPKDVIQIEPKELIKKRMGGKSPDYCDAWVLGFSRKGNRKILYVG